MLVGGPFLFVEEEVEFQRHAVRCGLQLPHHQLHTTVYLRSSGNEAFHILSVKRHVHLRNGYVLRGTQALCQEFFRLLPRYGSQAVEFDARCNVIFGENAQGKTNLLEALIYLSCGRSPRARTDREMIRFDAPAASLCAQVFAWIGFAGGAIAVVGVILAITVMFPAIRRAKPVA